MITIIKHNDNLITLNDLKNYNNIITLTDDEWNFLKTHVIENSLEFHSAVFNEFNEFAMDMININQELTTINFTHHKNLLKKLKKIGINTFDLEQK